MLCYPALRVTCKDKAIRIWDMDERELRHTLTGHEGEIVSLVWSPDGKKLASTSAQDQSLRIWDAEQGKIVASHTSFPITSKTIDPLVPYACAWSADSASIWVPFKSKIARLDVATGTWSDAESFTDPALLLSSDGKNLLIRSSVHYVRNDESKQGRAVTVFMNSATWHPDGRRLLGNFFSGAVIAYDTLKHEPLGVLLPNISGDNWLVVGPDGHYSGSREIDEHIVYVGQTDEGHNVTLSPAEFQKRFGWKNDPSRARLFKLDP